MAEIQKTSESTFQQDVLEISFTRIGGFHCSLVPAVQNAGSDRQAARR